MPDHEIYRTALTAQDARWLLKDVDLHMLVVMCVRLRVIVTDCEGGIHAFDGSCRDME